MGQMWQNSMWNSGIEDVWLSPTGGALTVHVTRVQNARDMSLSVVHVL